MSGSQNALVTLDTFKGDFSVPRLLDKLLEEVLQQQRLQKSSSNIARGSQHELSESRSQLQQLLQHFQRADEELGQLQTQVNERVQSASESVQAEEEAFQLHTEVLEGSMDETQANFQELNAQMTQISQTFARIGDHLQSAESKRKRALEAAAVVRYLQDFANGSDDLSDLPELFRSNDRLADAVAMCRKLLGVGEELLRGREQVGLGATPAAGDVAELGSMERAVAQLQKCYGRIDERVFALFDEARDVGDLSAMAACVAIMSQFQQRKMKLAERYITKVPMFFDDRQVRGLAAHTAAGSGDPAAGRAALAAVGDLCKRAQADVAKEVPVMEQVFQDPGAALALLVQRLFEQRIQAVVDRLLGPPPFTAGAEAMQAYLKLLTEAYKRIFTLADALQACEAVGDAAKVREHVDAVFNTTLIQHPDLERRWLQLAFGEKASQAQGLSMELLQQCMEWNAEAAERCKVLYAGDAQAANICLLFSSLGADYDAAPGCLLQQVMHHITTALMVAVEHCERSSQAPFTAAAGMSLTARQAVANAAKKVVGDGVGRVLATVALIAQAARLMQQHHARAVAPALQGALSVVAATGLASALDRAQGHALAALRSALEAFFAQADRTLMAAQQAGDFKPLDDALPETGPTLACSLLAPLLAALGKAAALHLHAANAESVSAEVGRRFGGLLTGHMQRWSFSPTGALRWKRDMGDYSDALRPLGPGAVAQARLDRLGALASVLLVPAESLVGVVEGELRLSHRQALPFIRLRADFKTARVDGSPLERLFSGD